MHDDVSKTLHWSPCTSLPTADDSVISDRHPMSTEVESKASALSTPRIDAVLTRFHKALDNKQLAPGTNASDSPGVNDSESHNGEGDLSDEQVTYDEVSTCILD